MEFENSQQVMHVITLLHRSQPHLQTPRFWVVPSSRLDKLLYDALTDDNYDYAPRFYQKNEHHLNVPIAALRLDVGFLRERDVLYFALSELNSDENRSLFCKIASDFVYAGYRLQRKIDRSSSVLYNFYDYINETLHDRWNDNQSVNVNSYFAYLCNEYDHEAIDYFFYDLLVDQGRFCRKILQRQSLIIDYYNN